MRVGGVSPNGQARGRRTAWASAARLSMRRLRVSRDTTQPRISKMSTRLSPNVKNLRGTVRNDRTPKPTALDRLRTAPQAPAHLSERARIEWKALAPVCCEMGTLTNADLRALELLCECL